MPVWQCFYAKEIRIYVCMYICAYVCMYYELPLWYMYISAALADSQEIKTDKEW